MSKEQWMKAWMDTEHAATMSLHQFQVAVMRGEIKLKWVKRPK